MYSVKWKYFRYNINNNEWPYLISTNTEWPYLIGINNEWPYLTSINTEWPDLTSTNLHCTKHQQPCRFTWVFASWDILWQTEILIGFMILLVFSSRNQAFWPDYLTHSSRAVRKMLVRYTPACPLWNHQSRAHINHKATFAGTIQTPASINEPRLHTRLWNEKHSIFTGLW